MNEVTSNTDLAVRAFKELCQRFDSLCFEDQKEMVLSLIHRMIESSEMRFHEAKERAEAAESYSIECDANVNAARSFLSGTCKPLEEPKLKSRW